MQPELEPALAYIRNAQFDAALTALEVVLTRQPDHVTGLYLKGSALLQLKRHDEAIVVLRHALALRPDHYQARFNLALAQEALGQLTAAVESYSVVLQQRPDFAPARTNRGNVYKTLRRFHEAIADYDRVLAVHPDMAPVHANRAVCLHDAGAVEAAIEAYDRVLALAPQDVMSWTNRGHALCILRRYQEALLSYEKALALAPEMDYLLDNWLQTRYMLCQWDGVEEARERLLSRIPHSTGVCRPFPSLSLTDDPAQQLKVAQDWVSTQYGELDATAIAVRQRKGQRVRIGYFSADFHQHATAYLMVDLFARHDREQFEIYAFAFGPRRAGPMRERLRASFDHFYDVHELSDAEVVALARECEIDIAVDLKGFTQDARFELFPRRCAPIQVNYLGHPGTLGADCIDYIIADAVLVEPGNEKFYTEQVVRLPGSYQVNDPGRQISAHTPTRADCELPEHAFVFCCFNNNYKIHPQVFAVWMRLLDAVPDSVLWLFEANQGAAEHLREAAQQHGVAPERLVFATRVETADHLARHRLADLFLDTAPYNAHTTASDALWAGLPIVTCKGQSFASRVAASLLQAVGLPELITDNLADYEALALTLARQPELLAKYRERLHQQGANAPLFDCESFTRHLESAYQRMQRIAEAGGPPRGFDVFAKDYTT